MKKIILPIALTAISMPVMANESSGIYGAIGAGVYRFESDGFKDNAPTTMFLGGYKLNDYVALEGSYSRLFDAKHRLNDIDITVDGHAWDLSSKLSVPLGNRFSPYGRLGWSYLDLKAVATSEGETVRANDYQDAFSWAIGTGIKLNQRLALNGEYGQVLVHDGDFQRLSMNVNYRFGSF